MRLILFCAYVEFCEAENCYGDTGNWEGKRSILIYWAISFRGHIVMVEVLKNWDHEVLTASTVVANNVLRLTDIDCCGLPCYRAMFAESNQSWTKFWFPSKNKIYSLQRKLAGKNGATSSCVVIHWNRSSHAVYSRLWPSALYTSYSMQYTLSDVCK